MDILGPKGDKNVIINQNLKKDVRLNMKAILYQNI